MALALVLGAVASQLASMRRFLEAALPHQFLRLMGEILRAFPVGDLELDLCPAAVVERLRLVRPDVPQHAASVLMGVHVAQVLKMVLPSKFCLFLPCGWMTPRAAPWKKFSQWYTLT